MGKIYTTPCIRQDLSPYATIASIGNYAYADDTFYTAKVISFYLHKSGLVIFFPVSTGKKLVVDTVHIINPDDGYGYLIHHADPLCTQGCWIIGLSLSPFTVYPGQFYECDVRFKIQEV